MLSAAGTEHTKQRHSWSTIVDYRGQSWIVVAMSGTISIGGTRSPRNMMKQILVPRVSWISLKFESRQQCASARTSFQRQEIIAMAIWNTLKHFNRIPPGSMDRLDYFFPCACQSNRISTVIKAHRHRMCRSWACKIHWPNWVSRVRTILV